MVIENERRCPGSQHRIASNDGCSSQDLFLWGQAMMIISDLLTSQLLNVYELDPIRRHLPSYNRPKLRGRYSAFDVRPSCSPYFLDIFSINHHHFFFGFRKEEAR